MELKVVIFLCALLNEAFSEDDANIFRETVVQLLKKDDPSYICYGGFFTKDKILTSCKCLGRYGAPEVQENAEFHFYTAFNPKKIYGIREDGKRFDGVKSNVYEICAPSLMDPSLYLHDLAVLIVEPEVEIFLDVIKPGKSFVSKCKYARTNRKDQKILQVPISRLSSTVPRKDFCSQSKLPLERCLKEIIYSRENEGFGIGYSDSPHQNDFGSPIVCNGTIIAVISKLQYPDVFYVELYIDLHNSFIEKAKSYG